MMLGSVLVLKVMVAGDGGVGKTTLIRKFVSGTFDAATGMTIGVQFHVKDMTYEGRPVSLQLWDLGGQEHFRFMLPSYTFGVKGAILLYDPTRELTLESFGEWVKICCTHNKIYPFSSGGREVSFHRPIKTNRACETGFSNEKQGSWVGSPRSRLAIWWRPTARHISGLITARRKSWVLTSSQGSRRACSSACN